MSCGWRVAWAAQGQQLQLHPARGHQHHHNPHQHRTATTNSPPRGAPSQRTAQAAPVGGLVATRSTASLHIGATLGAWQGKAGQWQLSRSRGHRLAGGPLQALQVAEARSAGPAATGKAQDAAVFAGPDLPGRAVLPDRLLSVSCMSRRSWSERWEARLQRWVLVDLDDVQGLDACGPALGSRLAQVALQDGEAGRQVAVVRTGPTGLQVWLQLAQPRHSPAVWSQHPEVRAWHHDLGQRLLQAAHSLGASGGYPDASACAAGRFGRRPGWRMMPDGSAFRAHLLASVCE